MGGRLQDVSIALSGLGALPQIINRDVPSIAASGRISFDVGSFRWARARDNALILTTSRDTFDTIGVSDSVAVQISSFFMGEDAKAVLPEQFALI